jgi:putative sigma-54 modulation protein
MKVHVVGRHFDITDAVKSYVEDRLQKIRRHFDRVMNVNVTLNQEKYRHIADIDINVNGVNMHCEEETGDMYTSIDLAVDKIDRQVRRYKEKLQRRKQRARSTAAVAEEQLPQATYELLEPDAGEVSEEERKIIRSERHLIKPMSLDEAVMQMDLNNADFYVFTNARTNNINVVYRRTDGNVGWIAPE